MKRAKPASLPPTWQIDIESSPPAAAKVLTKLGFRCRMGLWSRVFWDAENYRRSLEGVKAAECHGRGYPVAGEAARREAAARRAIAARDAAARAQADKRAADVERQEQRRLDAEVLARATHVVLAARGAVAHV